MRIILIGLIGVLLGNQFLFAQSGGNPVLPRDYKIEAWLKGGKIVLDTSIIFKRLRGHYIVLDEEVITPDQTDSIRLNNMIGVPAGSPDKNRWVWRIVSGKLSVFIDVPDTIRGEYAYLSKGDTMLPYSIAAMRTLVADNKKALRLVTAYRKSEITGFSILAAGLSIMVGGLALTYYSTDLQLPSMFDAPQTNPVFIAGAAVTVGSWIPFVINRNRIPRAIKTYNK